MPRRVHLHRGLTASSSRTEGARSRPPPPAQVDDVLARGRPGATLTAARTRFEFAPPSAWVVGHESAGRRRECWAATRCRVRDEMPGSPRLVQVTRHLVDNSTLVMVFEVAALAGPDLFGEDADGLDRMVERSTERLELRPAPVPDRSRPVRADFRRDGGLRLDLAPERSSQRLSRWWSRSSSQWWSEWSPVPTVSRCSGRPRSTPTGCGARPTPAATPTS